MKNPTRVQYIFVTLMDVQGNYNTLVNIKPRITLKMVKMCLREGISNVLIGVSDSNMNGVGGESDL